jgi:hypothetical protein
VTKSCKRAVAKTGSPGKTLPYMVIHFYFTVLDFLSEYFGLYVVSFLRLGLGLGLGLGFMCANKNKNIMAIYIYSKVQNDRPYMKYLPSADIKPLSLATAVLSKFHSKNILFGIGSLYTKY